MCSAKLSVGLLGFTCKVSLRSNLFAKSVRVLPAASLLGRDRLLQWQEQSLLPLLRCCNHVVDSACPRIQVPRTSWFSSSRSVVSATCRNGRGLGASRASGHPQHIQSGCSAPGIRVSVQAFALTGRRRRDGSTCR